MYEGAKVKIIHLGTPRNLQTSGFFRPDVNIGDTATVIAIIDHEIMEAHREICKHKYRIRLEDGSTQVAYDCHLELFNKNITLEQFVKEVTI